MAVAIATTSSVGELATLTVSWQRSLRAQNKSPRTITGYVEAARLLDEYLARVGMPRQVAHLRREHVEAFLAEQCARWRPATAWTRFRSLQQLFRWLVDEGEVRESPMRNMRPPAIPEESPAVLSDEELRRLLRACEGSGFADRRDLAIVRLFIDSGMRLAELAALRIGDIDLDQDAALVLGKGRRPRTCPFGARTAAAIDRYLRLRVQQRGAAARVELWLGRAGGPMTDSGIRQMITDRAQRAGLQGVHPHLFRHAFAHRWLAAGNGETDLMRLVGWRSRAMLGRYAASAADQRAREAYRRAAIGEQL